MDCDNNISTYIKIQNSILDCDKVDSKSSCQWDLNQVGFAVPIVQTVAVPAVATDHHATYTLAVNTVKTVAIKLLITTYTIQDICTRIYILNA